ncbi:MAG: prenyltransferase [Nocardioides sp.]
MSGPVTPSLSAGELAGTAGSIVAMQDPDGAIPWTTGAHTDVWNHLESAMALTVAGEHEAAERAYAWALARQRPDGSWPMKLVAGDVVDASGETNMSAYLAVAVWHHWLVRRDAAFVARCWPAVRRGLDWVVSLQLPFGGIAWSQEWADGRPAHVNEEALLAASSSVHHALRAGVSLAELVDDPQPEWELAGGRLRHAISEHPDLFLDKSQFSMDWYYPVLGGAVRGPAADRLLAARWDDFVVPDLGIRCVSTNPWVTGAETCELVLALEAIGDRERALRLFADVQHLREDDGRYWTGYVYPDGVNWPGEHSTYTAAAVILAADALADTTAGADIVRGRTLVRPFEPLGLECGCPSADWVAGSARRTA